ncbi:L,D-transpeptidase family protein [Nocardioides jishulii]|uniref:Peptidoglycan-binding protein n=1 Tax=Nocardioides jishulii TaxID=2575440 RepID=A0A4U2YM32_9ACTN|nr:peptidoglycan-binding protein [Nocardioides jishulii]QCX27489.1 peptidoglycan-binding protein [Nocardioides jishulii]TKI62296.1 peptidoglycan-binding protein [Nocardioides jishulii]
MSHPSIRPRRALASVAVGVLTTTLLATLASAPSGAVEADPTPSPASSTAPAPSPSGPPTPEESAPPTPPTPASGTPAPDAASSPATPTAPQGAAPATPKAEPTPTPTPSPTATPTAEPFVPIKMGEHSQRVRVLESRLHQVKLHSEVISSDFDEVTRRAVVAFKRKHDLPGHRGVVNEVTWTTLVALTREPTQNELNNVYKPGPALLKKGSKSPKVRNLEARLAQRKHFRGRVGATYDRKTVRAVRAFQKAARIPVTGKVDVRTLQRLRAVTRRPTRSELRNWGFDLDRRCLKGRVLCIDKTTRALKWVVDGDVKVRLDARFGDPYYPTREGSFTIFKKSRDHVSSIYHTPMPFAMFFSGGQAVHYSPDFARNGYDGHSHGCVNIRNRKAIARLFDQVTIGTKAVVHRS